MKSLSFLTPLFVALTCFSCQNTKDEINTPVTEKDTYQTVGEEIPYQVGMEWIEYYKKNQHQQGRLNLLTPYGLSGENLNALLQSSTNLVGIAFHYALDDSGNKHIIAIPIDESLSLWSSTSDRLMIDANTDSPISQEVTASWAQNYQDAYPDEIWFHFFGKNIFNDMRALPYFEEIDIEPAINVLNLTPQLLLVVYNDELLANGRTAGDDEAGTVYDASNPCPPCAVD